VLLKIVAGVAVAIVLVLIIDAGLRHFVGDFSPGTTGAIGVFFATLIVSLLWRQ
jgi:hypothetical protein